MQHSIIAEADDAQASFTERRFSYGIFILLTCVNLAIHLHNQPSRMAIEVHDVACNEMLAAKSHAIESISTQSRPQ